jgi:predicted transposase YdaD
MGAEATLSKISMDGWRWYFHDREKDIQRDYTTMIHGARREGRAEGKAEGARETAIENAKNLLKLGKLSCEEIAECCSLPLEEVQKFAEELTK